MTDEPYCLADVEWRFEAMGSEVEMDMFKRGAEAGQLVDVAKKHYVESDDVDLSMLEAAVADMLLLEDYYGDHWGFTPLPEEA